MKCKKCNKELAEGSEFCNQCGEKVVKAPVETPKEPPKETPKNTAADKSEQQRNLIIFFSLIGLVVALVVSNIIFFIAASKNGNSPISIGPGTTQEKCETGDKDKAESFDQLTSFLISKNAGKSSSKFYASEKVVILDQYTYDRSFTATMKYYKPAKMYWEYDNSYADVTTKKFKGFKAKMSITPKRPGSFYITFTNSKNNQEFKVLVIITD